MDEYEIRARALDAAVRMHAVWAGDTEDDVIQSARVFETYLSGNDTAFITAAVAYSAEPINVLRFPPGETVKDIWGAPCTRCTHATGMHLYGAGCVHPEGCECTWADAGADASALDCGCGHAKNAHSGSAQDCNAWVTENTVCGCDGYAP